MMSTAGRSWNRMPRSGDPSCGSVRMSTGFGAPRISRVRFSWYCSGYVASYRVPSWSSPAILWSRSKNVADLTEPAASSLSNFDRDSETGCDSLVASDRKIQSPIRTTSR
jgi:hypothetical protein